MAEVNFRITTDSLSTSRPVRYAPDSGIINSAIIHFPSGCFVPGTNIQLADGAVKPIETINDSDIALCHNSMGQVTKTFARQYNGPILNINSLIKATPEHPILAVKKDKVSVNNRAMIPNGNLWFRYRNKPSWEPTWIKAKDLENGDFILSPVLQETEDIDQIDLADYCEKKTYSHKEFGKKVNEQLKNGKIKNKYARHFINRYIKVDKDFLRLLGYYIAEGHITYDLKKYKQEYKPPAHPTGIGFTFGISEERYVQDVSDIIQKLFGLKISIMRRKNKNTIDLQICNSILAKLFKTLCGEHFNGKRIAPWIMTLPIEKQKHLIEGIWRGDGSMNGTLKTIKLKNETLLCQIYTILNRMKMHPSLQLRFYNISYLENCKNHKKFYYNNYLYTRIHSIKKQQYTGSVYNLQIVNHHSYVANNFAVHNCDQLVEVIVYHKTVQVLPTPAAGQGAQVGIALNDTTQSFDIREEIRQDDPLQVLVINHDSDYEHTVSVVILIGPETYAGP